MKYFNNFLKEVLSEELTPDQKEIVDIWKNRKKTPDLSKHVMQGESTIRIPLPSDEDEHVGKIPHTVHSHLENHGYSIPSFGDYKSGYALDKHGRIVSIGKVLNKTKASPEIKGHFENDPARQAAMKKDLHVAITKDPYHVAGMSTDRGWTSCMHMETGSNANYLQADIEHGTHVAYLVHKDDKDIKNPIARIALKPFKNSEGHVVLRPEESMYGSGNSKFHDVVREWSTQHFPMENGSPYKKSSNLYNDSDETIHPPAMRSETMNNAKTLIDRIGHSFYESEKENNIDHLNNLASRLSKSDMIGLVDHIHEKKKKLDDKIDAFMGIRREIGYRHNDVTSAVASHFLKGLSVEDQIKTLKDRRQKIDTIPKYADLDIDKKKIVDHAESPYDIPTSLHTDKDASAYAVEKFGSNVSENVYLHSDVKNSLIDREDYTPAYHSIPSDEKGMHKFLDRYPDLAKKHNIRDLFKRNSDFNHEHAVKLHAIEGKDGIPQKYQNLRYENLNPDTFKEDPAFASYAVNHIKDRRVIRAAIDHLEANPPDVKIRALASADSHVSDPEISKFIVSGNAVHKDALLTLSNLSYHVMNSIKHPDIPLSRKTEIFEKMLDGESVPHTHVHVAAKAFRGTSYEEKAKDLAAAYIEGNRR